LSISLKKADFGGRLPVALNFEAIFCNGQPFMVISD